MKMDIRVLEFQTDYSSGEPRDMVLYAPAHNVKDSQTWAYVERMRPKPARKNRDAGPKQFHMEAVWSFIGPKYEAWKAGMEMPETGTPLAAWAGVTRGQADELRRHELKTVEDLADANDTVLGKIHLPGMRRLRDAAKEYIAGHGAADAAKAMAEAKEERDAAMALLEELRAEMEEMRAARKPGRKPAQTEEAA
jgi:hypothetical protein